MGDSGGNSEDQNAGRNEDSEDGAHKVSGLFWDWIRGHSCYIMAKNLSTFCPCSETFKSKGLISLVEEMLQQHSTQVVA
jgi:hypothetical protein